MTEALDIFNVCSVIHRVNKYIIQYYNVTVLSFDEYRVCALATIYINIHYTYFTVQMRPSIVVTIVLDDLAVILLTILRTLILSYNNNYTQVYRIRHSFTVRIYMIYYT